MEPLKKAFDNIVKKLLKTLWRKNIMLKKNLFSHKFQSVELTIFSVIPVQNFVVYQFFS